MTEIHGPLYYNTLGKQGMLVEGFENIPPFNCLYNYPYYNDFMARLGFEKEGYAKDYLLIDGRWQDHVLTALTQREWTPDRRGQ